MIICNLCRSAINPVHSLRWRKEGFDILRCKSCGLIFRDHLPTNNELMAIYSDEYFFSEKGDTARQGYLNYLKDEEFLRTNFKRRLQRLKKFGCSGGMLLDIGAGAGFFIDEARKAGFTTRGIELSKTMAEYGRKQLGLDIWIGKFQDFIPEENNYDTIVMWDYLEHSIDPRGDLKKIVHLLKPGGVVALTTGNTDSFIAKLSGIRWHLLTPRHHLFYFSPRILKRYLDEVGFDVLSITHASEYYAFRYIMFKLAFMLPVFPFKSIAAFFEKNRLGGIGIPLNLFDIMTVVAKKR